MRKITVRLFTLCAIAVLVASCGMNRVPESEAKNYALIVSGTGQYGSDMDRVPLSSREHWALISWINGKVLPLSSASVDLPPGEYDIQVGIGCNDTRTCRPGKAHSIEVKAGYRYVLKPNRVLVSDRTIPRRQATEVPYEEHKRTGLPQLKNN